MSASSFRSGSVSALARDHRSIVSYASLASFPLASITQYKRLLSHLHLSIIALLRHISHGRDILPRVNLKELCLEDINEMMDLRKAGKVEEGRMVVKLF